MAYQTVRGMQDFLPERARKKKYIERVCREAFEKYGFSPLETPVVEDLELLTAKGSGGAAIENEIYCFEDKGGRKLGLRFDLTVPLSRVAATNRNIRLPFKRYQIGTVYRYDRPQAKRYREFTQADIDIIGSRSTVCEFELIAVSIEIMQRLGLKFYIIINSRSLLENLALACGVPKEKLVECFRAIDKAEKMGWEESEKELKAAGIDISIIGFLKENNLEKAEKKVKEKSLDLKGFSEVKELLGLLKEQKLDKLVKAELSLARGLEYYTGLVFEVKLEKGPSVGGGGRYDDLIRLYGGQDLPATGISFGIERLLDSLEEKIPIVPETRVLVVPVNKAFNSGALDLAQKIRTLGISTEMDLMEKGIGKNIEYADKKGIPFAIVVGERELKERKFKLKELKTGKETELAFADLGKLKELIKD
ncbi:MAG: histidine--tRNA ligase [Candidatus Diapherotrites archaeon]|nr:histidine--tRNA ligase [Candidatus Diapherotrites archaeon]